MYDEVFEAVEVFARECKEKSAESKDETLTALAMLSHQIDAYTVNIEDGAPFDKDVEFME